MSRVATTNGSWFDPNKAKSWREGTVFNGRNHVSMATGSECDHEELYRTASGAWVLNKWSRRINSCTDIWEVIDEDEAASWLIANEHFEDMPAKMLNDREI